MLFESAHVRVASEYGTATLWLDFPGEPVNALDTARLRELDAALAVVDASPAVRVLVLRSGKPAGFCSGVSPTALASLTTDADRAAFAWHGQQVLGRLARLPFTTVAFLDGPCLGAGLELALACDHRLCVARPTTHLGFPDCPIGISPGFGGSVRLRNRIGKRANDLLESGRTLSGREARALGLVDHAFCERRAKIELRTVLDRLESRPPPRRTEDVFGLSAERRRFTAALGTAAARAAIAQQLDALRPFAGFPPPVNPVPPFPTVVGLVGDDEIAAGIVAGAVLRGSAAVIRGSGRGVFDGIAVALARGFITPLDAEQARARVKTAGQIDRAGLVFVANGDAGGDVPHTGGPRCVVVRVEPDSSPIPNPREMEAGHLGCHVLAPHADTDTRAILAVWLKPFGVRPIIATPARMSAPAAA